MAFVSHPTIATAVVLDLMELTVNFVCCDSCVVLLVFVVVIYMLNSCTQLFAPLLVRMEECAVLQINATGM
jgi:hypothetical protein